jgi:hypothetical protein
VKVTHHIVVIRSKFSPHVMRQIICEEVAEMLLSVFRTRLLPCQPENL